MSDKFQQQYMQTPRRDDQRLNDARPCPFCGSRNQSLSRWGNYVHCKACGAAGPAVEMRPSGSDEMWRLAVRNWNIRLPC